MNVLKPHLQVTITTLLEKGTSQREIERYTGVDRKTIRRYARRARTTGDCGEDAHAGTSTLAAGSAGGVPSNSPTLATGSEGDPPAETTALATGGAGQVPANSSTPATGSAASPTTASNAEATPATTAVSACADHRDWIEGQVQLGRNAVSIYQELVEAYGFQHRYNSVKRFVAKLRQRDPERFDVLEFGPGEEAQVDFGQGAPTLYHTGKYRRPWLFVMTLKYSGKSYRTTVWKADAQTWAQLHEQAFLALGGVVRYVVLDNLKAGVLQPDIYEPGLNPVYAALLAHYGAVADPCRIADPNRKGTVESAIQHTQATALKGKRFLSLEAQNDWLAHWEERWAAPRIHGRKKRQVLEMYREEQPYLQPLPATRFRCFRQGQRTVDDGGLVQVEGSYYAATPAPPRTEIIVRLYDTEIELFDRHGGLLRRHARATRRGTFVLEPQDRVFNPTRETARLLHKAQLIGPHTAAFAQHLLARHGRPGQRALYGLTNLPRTYPCNQIEAICTRLLDGECFSYSTLRRALEHAQEATPPPVVRPAHPDVRDLTEYTAFFNTHAHPEEMTPDADVCR